MDLASLIINFASGINQPMWRLIWALSALIGVFCIGAALLKLQRASLNPGHYRMNTMDVLPLIIIGALLVNFSVFINTIWTSMGTGTVSYDAVSYDGVKDFGKLSEAINAVLTLARLGGGIFALRGMLFLKRAVSGESSGGSGDAVARAFTHLIGGALLVQIPDVIDAFRASFGLYW